MSNAKHAIWIKAEDWHKGEEYGCFFRHGYCFGKAEKYPKCYYPEHSYTISKTREDVYNSDKHYARAYGKGYLKGKVINNLVDARATELNDKYRLKTKARDGSDRKYQKKYTPKESEWKKKMVNMLQSSVDLLQRDSKAWHINYKIPFLVRP